LTEHSTSFLTNSVTVSEHQNYIT